MEEGQEKLPFNPEEYTLDEILKPKRCALLVIDIQNDFCDPNGFFATHLGADISSMQATVGHIQNLIDLAHENNISVIFTLGYEDPEFRDEPGKRRYKRWEMDGKICSKKGTFGSEFYQLQPKPEDLVLEKYDWSAFSGREIVENSQENGRNLEQILKEKGVQTLVVVGIKTEVCINATVTEAKAKHYFVVVPREAVATDNNQLHEAYLEGWSFSTGDVIGEDVIKNNWSSKTPTT